jgi:hypothetical protein
MKQDVAVQPDALSITTDGSLVVLSGPGRQWSLLPIEAARVSEALLNAAIQVEGKKAWRR